MRLHGDAVAYVLYRVPRRRHVHIVVGDEGRLEVRAPWRFSRTEAEAALHGNAAWVVARLRHAQRDAACRAPLQSGARLPLLDEQLRLEVAGERQLELALLVGRAGTSRVTRHGNTLRVHLPPEGCVDVRALVMTWYREEARRYLPVRLAALAGRVGVRYRSVAIRAQRTRWGSCSGSGLISLNWRLLLVPSTLVDYVLVHELCHVRHMNHSPAFWEMVACTVPDFRERRRRLRELQARLAL